MLPQILFVLCELRRREVGQSAAQYVLIVAPLVAAIGLGIATLVLSSS